MSIKDMLKEEWRMHSRVYRAGSFASFPFLVFFLTAGFTFAVKQYSVLRAEAIMNVLPFFGAFLGLGVGAIGFSSKSAFRNILGRTNYLIYSSRTLPVSENRLLLQFVVKDLIYYTAMFLVPVIFGYGIIGGFSVKLLWTIPAFLAGIIFSFLVARSSLQLPETVKPEYVPGEPLTQKSLLDLERSAGGLMKIVFSLTVLSGFYWFLVLNFPLAEVFLQQPLISFAALIGTISITVYNWLNRFDSFDDYKYMPVEKSALLKAKQKAFVKISFPLLIVLTSAPYFFYQGNLLLALVTSLSTATLALGSASMLFGLNPNTRIYDSVQFIRLLILNSIFVVPLLLATVFEVSVVLILVINGTAALNGILLARKSLQTTK